MQLVGDVERERALVTEERVVAGVRRGRKVVGRLSEMRRQEVAQRAARGRESRGDGGKQGERVDTCTFPCPAARNHCALGSNAPGDPEGAHQMPGNDYDPAVYGTTIADDYDDMYESAFDTAGAVDFLAELAGRGGVLEFGVGTGRLAVPLAQRGLRVHGVDASEPMIAKMLTKPGGEQIVTTVGDFSAVEVGNDFSLVVLAINTI